MNKPTWDRETALQFLSIPGTDPWDSLDELIARGKKAAIGAAMRTSLHVSNHIRKLHEAAALIEDAKRLRKPRPEVLWCFDELRPAIAERAFVRLQEELAWLLSRPDVFWQASRRQRYSAYTETQNAWRHM